MILLCQKQEGFLHTNDNLGKKIDNKKAIFGQKLKPIRSTIQHVFSLKLKNVLERMQ